MYYVCDGAGASLRGWAATPNYLEPHELGREGASRRPRSPTLNTDTEHERVTIAVGPTIITGDLHDPDARKAAAAHRLERPTTTPATPTLDRSLIDRALTALNRDGGTRIRPTSHGLALTSDNGDTTVVLINGGTGRTIPRNPLIIHGEHVL